MKKFLLLFSIIIAFTAAQAQEKSQKDSNAMAKSMTDEMDQVVALDANQKTKVLRLNQYYLDKMSQSKEKTKNDQNQMAAERKTISEDWEKEINGVLTAEQLKKWKDSKTVK